MCKHLKKRSGAKLKNDITSVFYNLKLISRALYHDDILKSIRTTANHFRDYHLMSSYEALEHAVSKRRIVIRDNLALSAKEPESYDDSDWSLIYGNSQMTLWITKMFLVAREQKEVLSLFCFI